MLINRQHRERKLRSLLQILLEEGSVSVSSRF